MLRFYRRNENYLMGVGMITVLLFLFIFPVLFFPFVERLLGLSKINGTLIFISRLVFWIELALLYLYCAKVEKQNILIWEDRQYPFSIYLASIIVIFAVLFVGLGLINVLYSFTHLSKTSEKLIEMLNIFRQNKPLLVFSALTAGITEEIIFRGYLQPRFQIIFNSPFLGILASSVLFGLLHYGYGTAINVIGPFFIGLVFAAYYWKYRNINVLLICHFLWDLLALFSLLKRYRA